MILFTFSKKSVKKVGLALDIGSKTVGGALFEKDAAGKIKLLYTAREPIAFQKILTGKNLLSAMLRSLELVLVHLEKYGLAHLNLNSKVNYHLDTVAAVVSSPWHASETKTLKLTREKPFVVTEALIGNLLAKEEGDFTERQPGGQSHDPRPDVLEHKIFEMRLNGYPTADPFGKKASQLELSIFTSLAIKSLIEKTQTLISRHFPLSRLQWHTFSLTAFASIRDSFPDIEDFLVVEVGGEVTDVTIAKKGILAEAVSFPLGHNGLLRALDRICNNHPECALDALLKLHRQAKLNSADKDKVERAIANAEISWLKFFNDAISNFSAETFLPRTVFLFEDGPYASIFEEFIKSAESSQLAATEPFTVKTGDDIWAAFAAPGQPLAADAVLAMEADFAARFENRP
ncbi:MAG: hypothetical protein HYV67_02645 [Candidatus Taylorbacteria bacterium]|nr:hypothetical protein [Candidatus Taylorbacteria bacterium]